MIELGPAAWILLGLGALVVGVSKTMLPGASILSIAAFAMVLPARTSTAVLLVLLIVGDVFALIAYRRHAHWPTLLRLAPAVLAGVILGAIFLTVMGDGVVRRAIGATLLLMIGVTLWQRRRTSAETPTGRRNLLTTAGYGTLGGFTTMVANAGGPVMSMYFLAMRTPVKVFLGTAAWFFAIVNLVKVPFLVGIGLLTPQTLLLNAVLAPVVVVGALVGIGLARRVSQRLFDRLIIVLTIAGSAYLLI